ncbi:MAG: hypothetical protein Q8934_14755 [Bacillota bacterium]|nr:hypothetical protein [Bacillota bacterium]
MEYIPQVSTAYYPEDAGWANRPNGENILLLCIPDLSYLITIQIESFHYAWLYSQDLDAYIFCFKINNKQEHAVIFKRDHAGVLLQQEFAFSPFTIVVTHKDLNTLTEKDPVLMLSDIELSKNDGAGW